MIQNDISSALQARVNRLQKDANRLFALGNIRERCQTAIKMFHEDMQPSPFTPWGAMLRDNREYRFALSLTLTYTLTKDDVIQLVKGCQEEYLLQEVEEERENQIEVFARMKISSRWYQMKDDDQAWRVFAQNIPYGEKDREEEIRQFFEVLDRICILTDILMGHAAEYGLNVEYEHMVESPEAPIAVQEEPHKDNVVDAIHELTDVPDAKAIGKCFKFDSDFVKRSVRTLVTEFYQGNNANLALIEITLFHHQQLKRRNSHKPFVMALAAWGIITIANDEEFKLIVMGVSDKYKRMPDEGYQEWDDNYKTDRLTCERMGKKLDPSMKYLE